MSPPYCMTSVINYLFVNWVFFETVKCESNFAIHLKNIVVQNYAWAHWSIQCNVQYWRILNACMMWKYSREHIQCIVYIYIYIRVSSRGGDRGGFDPPSLNARGGYPPTFFYLLIKVNCLQKSHIILEKQSEFNIFASQQNSSGLHRFPQWQYSIKINLVKLWAFYGYIISFDSEEGWSLLRSRFLICFMSLNDRSTVAVDMGKTIAIESKVLILGNVTHFASLLKNCNASFWSKNPFISSNKRDLNPFHSNLVSCMLTSARAENVSLSYSTVVGFP